MAEIFEITLRGSRVGSNVPVNNNRGDGCNFLCGGIDVVVDDER